MKKQWISVKCGLSRDPKHRQRMGESIWLFLHILDTASWDDGIVHDWKDEDAAEEMRMPVRTLREHRRKLAELEYITCNQKQYTQDIIIHNWTNPREYSGKSYNQKQGDMETEPSEYQGDTQGYTQDNRKDVTPTYSSNIKESTNGGLSEKDLQQVNAKVDAIIGNVQPQEEKDALNDFERSFGFGQLPWYSNTVWERFAKFVIRTTKQNQGWANDYVRWGKEDGKYKHFSNKKIRENPAAFMDTGYPEYEASKMYRKTDETRPQYDALAAAIEREKHAVPRPANLPPPNIKRHTL